MKNVIYMISASSIILFGYKYVEWKINLLGLFTAKYILIERE